MSFKNLETLSYYFEVKGSNGACLQHPIDPIIQKNLGILEKVFTMHKDDKASSLMLSMIPLLATRGK